VIEQRRDIGVAMIVKFFEEDLGREGGCAAKRVVNHNDVLDVEQIVHFGDRHENGLGAPPPLVAANRVRVEPTRLPASTRIISPG
jgi:hypothetical protein